MKARYNEKGFSLIELMVVVAIIGVIAGVAVPAYFGYISSSKVAVIEKNADTLAGFEDTYFYDNEEYLFGTYDPPGTNDLAALGWKPSGDNDAFKYVVEANGDGYKITVTYKNDPSIFTVLERP